MTEDLYVGGLMSAVYSQYWPANIPRKQKHGWNIDGRFEKKNDGKRTSCDGRRSACVRGYDGVERELAVPKRPFRRECWADDRTSAHNENGHFDAGLDSLTKAEFKRLKEQIRDVSASLGYKFRGSGYKNFVQKEEQNPVLYRSQLADSLKTFRGPSPRPPPETKKPELTRCRPIIGTKPICKRPQTAPASYQTQPRPQRTSPPSGDVTKQTFTTYDSLNSDFIYNLANRDQLDSGYGDLTLSGDEADQTIFGDEVDSSDDEQPEPKVDQNLKIPQFPALRPDPLENMYMSEGERDYEKYDFDASKTDIPKYEYKYSGPIEFEKVDFEDLASYGKDWRLMTKRRPAEAEMELLIDKLIELERLVTKTEDWEDRRREKCRYLNKQKQAAINNMRAQGRRPNTSKPDKRCCKNCLQVICAGDCPLKSVRSVHFCLHCRQEYCSGNCVHLYYNSFSRMTASESDSDSEAAQTKPQRKPRPKSCQTCRRQDTNVKVINTNQILQGRPKSSLATFNRGKSSAEAKELIGDNHECHDVIEEEFRKLNIVPNSRPSTANTKPPRGRAALVPGKSYFSQRHDSISVPKAERVKSAPPRLGANGRPKRVKSARGRRRQTSRPGTAASPASVPSTIQETYTQN